MPTYLRDEHAVDHFNRSTEALEGIGHLKLEDMLVLMGADPDVCDETDREFARRDLLANGYAERHIAQWGRRRIFKRWVIVGRDREWCRQNLPDGEGARYRPFRG